MQAFNIWNKLHIRWREVALILLLFVGFYKNAFGQDYSSINLSNYDEHWIHYGFLAGWHSSKYLIRYSDAFTQPAQDTVHSIIPGNLGGFKLGFVVNMRLSKHLDFRILPSVGFYENDLTYRFTDSSILQELKDATIVELPLLIKYKSVRKENLVMYMVFGINPSLETSGTSDEQGDVETLELKTWDVSVDVGLGLDIFYPFFKFSPEIRYSYGLRNMLNEPGNKFSVGLDRLTNQNLGIFITFEGGPKTGRNLKRRGKNNSTSSIGKVKNRQKNRLKQ